MFDANMTGLYKFGTRCCACVLSESASQVQVKTEAKTQVQAANGETDLLVFGLCSVFGLSQSGGSILSVLCRAVHNFFHLGGNVIS